MFGWRLRHCTRCDMSVMRRPGDTRRWCPYCGRGLEKTRPKRKQKKGKQKKGKNAGQE